MIIILSILKEGWPLFDLGSDEVQYTYPINAVADENAERFSGNYYFYDDFNKTSLKIRYSFLRTKRENWYDLSTIKGSLSMNLRPQTCSGTDNPSFIGFRQSHIKGYAAVSLNFNTNTENENAGLMIFQNEQHYYNLCKSVESGKPVLQLYKGAGVQDKKASPELLASVPINSKIEKDICLKIEADGDRYNFYYALKKRKWILFKAGLDGKFLSTKGSGGFVGCMYTMMPHHPAMNQITRRISDGLKAGAKTHMTLNDVNHFNCLL
jgi:alpha-N-arabinofuranosidase